MGLLQRDACGVLAGVVQGQSLQQAQLCTPRTVAHSLAWAHLPEKLALLLQGQFLQQAATTIGLPDLSPGAAASSLLAPSSPLVPHQQLVVSAPLVAACPTSSLGNAPNPWADPGLVLMALVLQKCCFRATSKLFNAIVIPGRQGSTGCCQCSPK